MESILWILFIVACILTTAIILLQEGKGGGLGEAFGGAGQQMVGVKAEGITKFTGYLAVAVVVLAIVITKMRSGDSAISLSTIDTSAPGSVDISTPVDTGAGGGNTDGGDGK